jgi:hypothetical protein
MAKNGKVCQSLPFSKLKKDIARWRLRRHIKKA